MISSLPSSFLLSRFGKNMSRHLQRTWEEVGRVYTQSLFGFPFMSNWLWMTKTIYADHFSSNLDFNQLISQPLLTLTSCSSYLLSTHSPVSHVAGAPGQHSSLSLVWSQCWIIVICRRNAYPKVASSKSKTNCTELFAFETYSNCWYIPILNAALICCPDTV